MAVEDVDLATPTGSCAVDTVGGKVYQLMKRTVGADGLANFFLDKIVVSAQHAAAESGAVQDVSFQGMSKFALQVKGNGAVPTNWSVSLQTSLNGSDFSTVLVHDKANNGDGGVVSLPVLSPTLYFRYVVDSLTLGGATSITVTAVGLP